MPPDSRISKREERWRYEVDKDFPNSILRCAKVVQQDIQRGDVLSARHHSHFSFSRRANLEIDGGIIARLNTSTNLRLAKQSPIPVDKSLIGIQ